MAEDKNTKSGAGLNFETARPTGAARPSTTEAPTGKRSATNANAVAKKPAAKKPAKRASETDELSTRNPITFLKQVVAELRKVIWPTGRQMVTYTIVVLLFLIFMVTVVWGVDTLAGLGVRSIFSS
ncbi:preprotein translocase subunit SecE [Corynebacterium sp. H78]|uniref:preprotein translocase subunit SecE n=1 Tax=Corynebacterium sp. H78 TaxID=3133417 RepID=UPI0030B47B4C